MDTYDAVLSLVALQLERDHTELGTWDKVAEKYGMPKRTLHRIATEPGYCPKWLRQSIRQSLRSRACRDLLSMSKGQLLWALENRS